MQYCQTLLRQDGSSPVFTKISKAILAKTSQFTTRSDNATVLIIQYNTALDVFVIAYLNFKSIKLKCKTKMPFNSK